MKKSRDMSDTNSIMARGLGGEERRGEERRGEGRNEDIYLLSNKVNFQSFHPLDLLLDDGEYCFDPSFFVYNPYQPCISL